MSTITSTRDSPSNMSMMAEPPPPPEEKVICKEPSNTETSATPKMPGHELLYPNSSTFVDVPMLHTTSVVPAEPTTASDLNKSVNIV
jgi:hypothetical protein